MDRPIQLCDHEVVAERSRSLVLRCGVNGCPDLRSIIIKQHKGDAERGFTDWASLAFLSSLSLAHDIAPHFWGGHAQERFFLMEDLGAAANLERLLDQADAGAVATALTGLAQTMARLVVAGYGQESAYQERRSQLPGDALFSRQTEARRWRDARERVERWAEIANSPMSPGFEAACDSVALAYVEPGAYLAFSHGDPAPSNNHCRAGRVHLLDFEYGCFRHLLYDLSGWAILCPLPDHWLTLMVQEFRRSVTVTPIIELLQDERGFKEAWAQICAYRALAMLSWLSPTLLDEDGEWASGWTGRAALLSTALRLHKHCEGVPQLEPLVAFGERLGTVLQARWPELGDGAPAWPAASQLREALNPSDKLLPRY